MYLFLFHFLDSLKGRQPEQERTLFIREKEELLRKEPGLSDLQIANRLHCSTRTANKWRTRLRQLIEGEKMTPDELEDIYGQLFKYSEHKRGDTITFRDPVTQEKHTSIIL